MERKTFVLAKTKPFRHHLKLFLPAGNDKVDQRIVTFTTEHKVKEKERVNNARKKHAEYITSDERIIDALLRDTGYGKVFYLKGDEKGKLGRDPIKVTPFDAQKSALSNLFKAEGLEFDVEKSLEVLNAEYQYHIQAKLGVDIKASGAAEIPHQQIDVHKSIKEQAQKACKVYEERYGEPVPDEFKNDYALLDGLSNPNFDAKEYLKSKGYGKNEESGLPEDPEDLRDLYFQTLKKRVPNAKKHDIAWIKEQLEEVK